MTRPPLDAQNHVAFSPRKFAAPRLRGGLVVWAGLLVSLPLSLALSSTGQAQSPDSASFPTGVDIIPADLPAHASEPVSSNRPRSLLPGTIPMDDTNEGDNELPSLATRYYQTLTGTGPAPKPKPAKRSVSDTAKSTPVTPPPTVRSTPAQQQDKVTVLRSETATPVTTVLPNDPDGRYLIQLGAFQDTLTAESYWASFMVRYPTLSKSHDKQIVTADLGTKGIFHRLQLTGFTDFEAAKQQCRQLKSDGTDCFATRY